MRRTVRAVTDDDFDSEPRDSQPQGRPPGGGAVADAGEAAGAVTVGAPGQQAFIWGTRVDFGAVQAQLTEFFRTFRRAFDPVPMYPELLRAAAARQDRSVNVDCANVFAYDEALYNNLVRYPSQVIPIMDVALNAVMAETLGEAAAEEGRVQVRTFNLRDAQSMRELGPPDIDTLVAVRGMVVRSSSLVPNMREAYFRCSVCSHGVTVGVDIRDRIAEPSICEACDARASMVLVHNRSAFADKQVMRLQETPESIPEGETPQTVTLFLFDSLVDAAKPGDRVEVTGIFRAEPTRANPNQRTVRALYRTFIDAIHFRKNESKRMCSDAMASQSDPGNTGYIDSDEVESRRIQNEEELRGFAALPDIYERLTRSLAPSIWELEDVKKGLLCQLFGGTNKEFASGQRFRGEINILLCGDPSTSKSQLLSCVHKIAPRGVYTSGKGSSAVGLTAYVSRDPDTNDAVLESGALVLSDRGICCIDEFDKMSDLTRAVLHEVMEQQTVSIAKSGVVCSLNARTAVLASANPRESRYNPKLSVVENIQLPPTLLSRFDLIYLVLDKPDEAFDRKLGEHLVSLFSATPPVPKDTIPIEKLTAYITLAKQTCHPKISDDAKLELVKGYVEMRKQGMLGGRRTTITATPRQLESLIRTSEALARMRLQDEVGRREVAEALRLVRGALQQAAIDPRTGTIDMDVINTGRSASSRHMMENLARVIRDTLSQDQTGRPWQLQTLLESIRNHSDIALAQTDLQDALMALHKEGAIEIGHNFAAIRMIS